MEIRLAKIAEVESTFRVSEATIDRHVKLGLIPSPVTILGVRYWDKGEITAVESAMLQGAGREEIKGLVAFLKEARHQGLTATLAGKSAEAALTWTTPFLRAEALIRDAGEDLEFKRWQRALDRLAQARAELEQAEAFASQQIQEERDARNKT